MSKCGIVAANYSSLLQSRFLLTQTMKTSQSSNDLGTINPHHFALGVRRLNNLHGNIVFIFCKFSIIYVLATNFYMEMALQFLT